MKAGVKPGVRVLDITVLDRITVNVIEMTFEDILNLNCVFPEPGLPNTTSS
jgi:hypothetical protein